MTRIVAGRYELIQALGKGGMKEVWRSRDRRSGDEVALALLFRFEPELFANELALARRIESPHVARVLEGGICEDGEAYVVTELCAGPDLRAYRHHRGALPWPEAAALIHQLARGLDAIHQAHVLHRDIKPDNAIFTAAGVKVIDFGISLPAIDANTDVGAPVPPAGTLVYMAPEVFRDRVDARTDVYALGVTLFELGAGRPPLSAPSGAELIQRILTLEAHDLGAMQGAPQALRSLVAEMVAVNQGERPRAAEVASRLAEFAGCAPHAPAIGPHAGAPAAPTLLSPAAPRMATPPTREERAPFRHRLTIELEAPVWPSDVIATGWDEAPYAVMTRGEGTRVSSLTESGARRWSRSLIRNLEGGLAADLDGDGIAELYLWSRDAVIALDEGGELCFEAPLPPLDPAQPEWEHGPPSACVIERRGRRCLALADRLIDAAGALVGRLERRYQGDGAELVESPGDRGLSVVGRADQAFRGDFATPAALLISPGAPGFRVAHLERVLGDPSIRLSIYGPGGTLTASATVGVYDLKTAPIAAFGHANHPSTRLFDGCCAPLSVAVGGDHMIAVPYLVNAPWFGPVVVGIGSGGEERWRTRLEARGGGTRWPPMLAAIGGRVEILIPSGGVIDRIDAVTGDRRDPLRIPGDPVALGDFSGRGTDELVVAVGDKLLVFEGGDTEPGRVRWVGARGDLWRSGSLGPDGLPVGPMR